MSLNSSVAIIGLGYVGLPLAQLCIKNHIPVIGIDIDPTKIEKIHHGQSYLSDMTNEEVQAMQISGLFQATTSFSKIPEVDNIIICVPTPIMGKEPDLTYIQSAVDHIEPYLRENHLVVLESSTFPGTTEEILKKELETDHLKVGVNLFIGYSPERVDPGNKLLEISDFPKVVSGVTARCLERVKSIYQLLFHQLVPVSSPAAAEFTKMLENSQRLINISFMNEMNILANHMGIDLWEVIEAAKTKPIGFTPYYPSPGIGGHCIPVDPVILSWVGRRRGVPLTMIDQADAINDHMPTYITDKVITELGNAGLDPANSSIGIIGITYKKDVNDIRESAALKIATLLRDERKADVYVYDPLYPDEAAGLQRFNFTPDALKSFDIVLILVDHSIIPWVEVARHSRRLIDTRNVMRDIKGDHILRI